MHLELAYVLLMLVSVGSGIITSSNPVPEHMLLTETEIDEHSSDTFTVRNRIQCAGICLKVNRFRSNP